MRKTATANIIAALFVGAIVGSSHPALADDCRPIERQIASVEAQLQPFAAFCQIPGVCAQGQRQLAHLRARLTECRKGTGKARPPQRDSSPTPNSTVGYEDCSRFDRAVRRSRKAARNCKHHCGGKFEGVRQAERNKQACYSRNYQRSQAGGAP